MSTVTCRTEGCPNVDEPIELVLTWVDDDGIEHDVDAVICGVCGHPITDITD